jgi:hypothetical protein
MSRVLPFFRAVVDTAGSTLREIFDETAYARFLARTREVSSRAAFTEFLRERAAQRERQARCC